MDLGDQVQDGDPMIPRFAALVEVYTHLDIITLGLVLISTWVVATGHLLDWLTTNKARWIIPVYWTIIMVGYLLGMVYIGITYK
jgi:hypothetical protein